MASVGKVLVPYGVGTYSFYGARAAPIPQGQRTVGFHDGDEYKRTLGLLPYATGRLKRA